MAFAVFAALLVSPMFPSAPLLLLLSTSTTVDCAATARETCAEYNNYGEIREQCVREETACCIDEPAEGACKRC